ncbi:MAG0865 family DivIVA-related protein [Mycoplasmopsis iners]|uniref:MAG0865 family DivIVA-related protein n=1 Tax=Mycoplasmopsis iners TaxID=76630 RepID=UPI0004975CF2|nr:DivIVA domain-containing protein [Mycoplasmopsis iners]
MKDKFHKLITTNNFSREFNGYSAHDVDILLNELAKLYDELANEFSSYKKSTKEIQIQYNNKINELEKTVLELKIKIGE